MCVEEFRALLTRMKRVIAILEEDGHSIEEQNARRDELRKLVGLLKNVK